MGDHRRYTAWRSLLIALPAGATMVMWFNICSGRPTRLLGVEPERLLLSFTLLNALSLSAAIGHLAWSRATIGAVACLVLNLLGFLANILGFLLLRMAIR